MSFLVALALLALLLLRCTQRYHRLEKATRSAHAAWLQLRHDLRLRHDDFNRAIEQALPSTRDHDAILHEIRKQIHTSSSLLQHPAPTIYSSRHAMKRLFRAERWLDQITSEIEAIPGIPAETLNALIVDQQRIQAAEQPYQQASIDGQHALSGLSGHLLRSFLGTPRIRPLQPTPSR